MFRHRGKSRTYQHNLRLASILSFVAGIVNITGVLAIQTLTTNLTGHFAFFAEEIVNERYSMALIFMLYVIAFLSGAFLASLLTEAVLLKKPKVAHALPMSIEILVLSAAGVFGDVLLGAGFSGYIIACALLFAMGMQNSLVTKVSGAVVRTTHLTGLFTDLGIELSQLFYYRKTDELNRLSKSIYLRLIIIGCFFFGCILGGFIYLHYAFKTLFLASASLLIALFYDNLRLRFYNLRRRVQRR